MTNPSKRVAEKIKKGTLLAIPVSDEKFALSQIYRDGISFYLVIYDGVLTSDELTADRLVKPILASWTNDAEVYRGRWALVGNATVKDVVPEPEYKVLVSGQEMVESFDGKYRRTATIDDESLQGRKSRSPRLVEDVIRAFHGFEKWSRSYDDMLIAKAGS